MAHLGRSATIKQKINFFRNAFAVDWTRSRHPYLICVLLPNEIPRYLCWRAPMLQTNLV
jgi:hypothetical protein